MRFDSTLRDDLLWPWKKCVFAPKQHSKECDHYRIFHSPICKRWCWCCRRQDKFCTEAKTRQDLSKLLNNDTMQQVVWLKASHISSLFYSCQHVSAQVAGSCTNTTAATVVAALANRSTDHFSVPNSTESLSRSRSIICTPLLMRAALKCSNSTLCRQQTIHQTMYSR